MKKLPLICTLSLAAIATAFVSCDDEETYADQKERENNQIMDWIADHDIQVISMEEFLKDTVTDNPETGPDKSRNEYVLFQDNGVYMQIIRRGQGIVMPADKRWNLNARYVEVYIPTGDTLSLNLKYTYSETMTVQRTGDKFTASFTSGNMAMKYGNSVPNSWLMVLPFIKPGFLNGEPSAKVRLIVPHNQGTQTAASKVYPTFYEITISTEKWQ